MSRPPEPLLRVEQLDAGYGPLQILFGVSLEVGADEQVLVFGPNGAGKSTLMKALLGLVRPTAGRLRFRERDIAGLATEAIVRRGVGYVPQINNVFGSMTVYENLEMGGATLSPRAAARRVRALEERFPLLGERRRQPANTLSGGQRQLLAMARALMPEPALLLLDEPTAGLAPLLVTSIFETARTISRSGTAVLMVEQNARQALEFVDRGVVLENGTVRATGTALDLRSRDDIAALYLGVAKDRH
ncbi:MAG: ABC transporter ATP-binding protein [Trueperaceae bacterium]|jgi:ABC-type branched-subunit amino acid transport system ATPase component|nr:ABC transporter ATP-binding protein [Truepera sp.]HRP48245.1 ABC transporter ATP-binding protein [Trueperaceae bacterium]